MPPIQSDGALLNDHPEGLHTDDDILNAFMTGLHDEEDDGAPVKEPPKKKVEAKEDEPNDDDTEDEETSEETPEETEEEGEDDEGTEDDKDTEDKDPASKKYADDDETYVKIKVGEEEHEVKVTDLKRLWGQEKALTQRSQETAAAKTAYDEGQAKNIAAYDVLLKRATERANEYRKLPWTQLMKDPNVPADQLAALQAEAQKALEEETFLKNEIDGFMKKVADDQKVTRQKAAADCLKALNDKESPHHIKGWNEALYNDIRSFATSQGLPKDMVNALTDPGAFKVLHMAMLYSRGKTKVVTTKVNKSPTKIVKNSASAPAARSSSKTIVTKQAVAKAKKSGSMDDAMAAFEAME